MPEGAFLHLRFCMFAVRTIENEYRRNPFDMWDDADKIHRLPAKKNFVWTCNKDTKEQAFNDGSVVGIMRITDLMA